MDQTNFKEYQPTDLMQINNILSLLGISKTDKRVPYMINDFGHAFVTSLLTKAKQYSEYANRKVISPADIL